MKKFIIICIIFYMLVALSYLFPTNGEGVVERWDYMRCEINKFRNKLSPIEFNGEKLADAIRLNKKTENQVIQMVSVESNTYKKAFMIYKWITSRVVYDAEKKNNNNIAPNAQLTYDTRKGICLDYAVLFSAFCKVNNIKNRIMVGSRWTGKRWGNHAWNEFYCVAQERWVKVDCTFGVNGNHFDFKNEKMYKNTWVAIEF